MLHLPLNRKAWRIAPSFEPRRHRRHRMQQRTIARQVAADFREVQLMAHYAMYAKRHSFLEFSLLFVPSLSG